MTRHSSCCMVAVLSCLLALATSEATEDKWVVWHRSVSLSFPAEADLWVRVQAFRARRPCDAMAAQLDGLYGGVGETARGSRYQAYVWCLPDTLDPRGPRGK